MGGAFEAQLRDGSGGFAVDASSDADTLLAAFGGIVFAMGIPPWEFFRSVGAVDAKRLFARDLDRCCYLRGIRGLGNSVPEAAAGLSALIDQLGVRRTVFTGNSSGGMAAILFGVLVGADEVIAFSPYTFTDRWHRFRYRDERNADLRPNLSAVPGGARWRDVRPVIARSEGRTSIHIHFSEQHRLDRLHAERLRGLPGVALHPYPEATHRLIGKLAASGSLADIFRDSVQGPAG